MIPAILTCVFVIWMYRKLAKENLASDTTSVIVGNQIESRLTEIERRVQAMSQSAGGTKT